MKLFPAIDLKDGKCVRLEKGLMDKVTVFNDSPAAQAREFVKQGCEFLHMVDLNGAFAGTPVNAKAVRETVAALGGIPCQLGGGIRNMDTIDMWLKAGVSRVILGTVALKNPELVKMACAKYPGRIAVGIDAKDGYVAVEGWAETSDMLAVDLAKAFAGVGVAAIIHTDVARDGVLTGPNVEATVELAEAVDIPFIVSGGVASIEDLAKCKAAAREMGNKGTIEGVISGRAIYDNRINVAEAITVLKG